MHRADIIKNIKYSIATVPGLEHLSSHLILCWPRQQLESQKQEHFYFLFFLLGYVCVCDLERVQ